MIKLIKPDISWDEVRLDFQDVFDSGIFTRGKNVDKFAHDLSKYLDARHVFLTTSATTALSTCLKLLAVGPGDEVLVADFSFPATANVVEDLGAKTVLLDVNPLTFNLCPDELLKKITNKTKAVIFVDTFGNPTGLHAIKDICNSYRVPLIEDAACAIGSSEKGLKCGAIADLTCFSFHPRKIVCTGEGGAITTNNDDWANWLRVKLAHGADGMVDGQLNFTQYGYNYRLPELSAIMGIKQLEKLGDIVVQRNNIRDQYNKELLPLGFTPQYVASNVISNIQSLVYKVPKRVKRNALIEGLRNNGIETTIGTYSQSNQQYYRLKYNANLPVATELAASLITFPCYAGLNVGPVIDAIHMAVNNEK
jgi:perosamine synthetase